MRKVYQDEKSGAGVAVAVFFGVGFTALILPSKPFVLFVSIGGNGRGSVNALPRETIQLNPGSHDPTVNDQP